MKARIRALGDFFAVLGGARLDLLAREPGARARWIAMGGVVVSTGALAALSMGFALTYAVGVPLTGAVALGLLWGVIIVNLDRLLIVGLRHDTSRRRTLLLALPRVGLAVLLGVVIATPLTLKIFGSEVDREVAVIQRERAAENREALENDPRFTLIPELNARIAANQAIVDSGGRTDPDLAPVFAEVDRKRGAYNDARPPNAPQLAYHPQRTHSLNERCLSYTPSLLSGDNKNREPQGLQTVSPRTRANRGARRLPQARTVGLLIALPILAMTLFATPVAAAALVC